MSGGIGRCSDAGTIFAVNRTCKRTSSPIASVGSQRKLKGGDKDAVAQERLLKSAQAALESGRHVICEKPLATTLQDAQALADAVTQGEADASPAVSDHEAGGGFEDDTDAELDEY